MIKFQNYIQQTFLTHPIVYIIVFLSRLAQFNLNKLLACHFLMNCKTRFNTSVKIILNMSSMNEFAHVCVLLCSTYNTVTSGQHRNVFLFLVRKHATLQNYASGGWWGGGRSQHAPPFCDQTFSFSFISDICQTKRT